MSAVVYSRRVDPDGDATGVLGELVDTLGGFVPTSPDRIQLFALNGTDEIQVEFDDASVRLVNEVQTLTLSNVSAGDSFRLARSFFATHETPALDAANVTAAQLAMALEELEGIGRGNVQVTEVLPQPAGQREFRIEFTGDLGNRDVPELDIRESSGGLGFSVDVTSLDGKSKAKEQTVTLDATSGTFTLEFDGKRTRPLEIGVADAADVLLALSSASILRECRREKPDEHPNASGCLVCLGVDGMDVGIRCGELRQHLNQPARFEVPLDVPLGTHEDAMAI